jgi:hypothetical protein
LLGAFLQIVIYSDIELIAASGVDITIEIIGAADDDSDELELSGPGEVDAGRKITWIITENAKDELIWFEIEKKQGHRDVFQGPNPTGTRQRPAVGQLKKNLPGHNYEYSINWVDLAGGDHTYDPKIAIRPGTRIFEILLLTFTYILLVVMISFMTFKK